MEGNLLFKPLFAATIGEERSGEARLGGSGEGEERR